MITETGRKYAQNDRFVFIHVSFRRISSIGGGVTPPSDKFNVYWRVCSDYLPDEDPENKYF